MSSSQDNQSSSATPTIFIVHGRNERYKEAVARLVERAVTDSQVTILAEQPDQRHSIIEKFEHYSSRSSFAIVLMTGDDEGRTQGDEQLNPRARQNVVLELGYFVGKFGPSKVTVLHEEGVEIPSDIYGVAYISLDPSDHWRFNLATKLRDAGLPVDRNRM